MGWLENLFRSLLFFFDQIIYGFIPTVYNFIMDLARVQLFSDDKIQKMANSIYAILGLYMIFRVAFILLNVIVDPEKLADKEAGVGKIFSRVIVGLILIAAIPVGFSVAYQLQTEIIDKQVIEKVIIGRVRGEGEQSNNGMNMGYLSLSSFLTCRYVNNSTTSNDIDDRCAILEDAYNAAFPKDKGMSSDFSKLSAHLNDQTPSTDGGGGYVYNYDYKAIISTIAGGVILAMLVTFCFDIAVRLVKLGFLQIITPVAVIGYIEPKGTIFNKWLKMCISTYINLFLRVITISFVAFTMSAINLDMKTFDDNPLDPSTKVFATIFVVIGLLIFAKELPKVISNLFGIEETGLGGLNPFKRLGSVPFLGGAAMAGVGYGASLGARLLAWSGGALGGGLGSALRGGSFRSGAIAGKDDAKKKTPIGMKPNYKGLAGGVLGSGFKGAYLGLKSEDAKVSALQRKIDAGGGDHSSIFRDANLKSTFTDYSAKKKDVRARKEGLMKSQHSYNNQQMAYNTAAGALSNANARYTRASQLLASATSSRDTAMAKASDLKQAMDKAWTAGGNNYLDPSYLQTKNNYTSYTSSTAYNDAVSGYSSAQTEFTSAQTELSTSHAALSKAQSDFSAAQSDLQSQTSDLAKAEKEFAEAESRFNAQLGMPTNKKDAEDYKVYKAAKDAGRIK